MADRIDDTETEKPLDPAVVRVQQRLQGMMLWSRGIMLVGFAALFGVIFYKFYWTRPTAAETLTVSPVGTSVTALPMPDGGHITSSRAEGNRLVVTIDAPKAESVLIIDLETMQTLRRLDFTKTP
jgi:hypothetical protein